MPNANWSYALNQWHPTIDSFVRREQHERALKTLSAARLHAVEITCGPGRWEPLGNRQMIELNHGSVAGLRRFLAECDIQRVSSLFLDPGAFLSARSALPLSAGNPQDHAEILSLAREYLELLPELGGECLVVKAAPAFWRIPEGQEALIATLADCWNAVARLAAASSIQVGLHLDCLCAIRTPTQIKQLLEATDADTVGLAIDTAEYSIAGLDPLAALLAHPTRVNHFHLKQVLEVDALEEYRLPHAELLLMSAGGRRQIARWFWELGATGGRVDVPALWAAAQRVGYRGWFVIESDQSPYPATSALLNAWYVQHCLAGSGLAPTATPHPGLGGAP